MADDVDVAGTISSEHTELVVDAAEICEAKGGDLFVVGGGTGDKGKLGGGFGGFRGGPDDIWGLYGGMGEVIDGGELGNIEDEAAIGELAGFVAI